MGLNDYSFLFDENEALHDTYSALTGDNSFPTLISDGVKVSYGFNFVIEHCWQIF